MSIGCFIIYRSTTIIYPIFINMNIHITKVTITSRYRNRLRRIICSSSQIIRYGRNRFINSNHSTGTIRTVSCIIANSQIRRLITLHRIRSRNISFFCRICIRIPCIIIITILIIRNATHRIT